jgi:hypothetical protein
MTWLTIGRKGEIALPRELQERYRMTPDTPIRIIETREGILLIPLTEDPMSGELARELAEWQSLGALAWEMFPYEDEAE